MTANILSLVGIHALAVVSPIVSFLEQFHKDEDIDISLLVSDASPDPNIGKRCLARQTKKRFYDKEIQLFETDHRAVGLLNSLVTKENPPPNFNVTPGTRMQTVALVMAARKLNHPERVVSIDKGVIRGLLDEKIIAG